jgi:hypothetical protein
MRKSLLTALFAFALLVPLSTSSYGGSRESDSRHATDAVGNPAFANVSKCENTDDSLNIATEVVFSDESGRTVTDENGTCYNVAGVSLFEDKVYPPAYWGVFPLYFFGDTVGVTLQVVNNTVDKKARLRLTTECYCLRTDGSNGAKLLAPQEFEVTVLSGETKTVDASFGVDYTADAESGLDRFLVKAYRAVETGGDGGEHTICGVININPNNSEWNEFMLTLPDGSVISDFTLYNDMPPALDNLPHYFTSYSGPAVSVRVKPKGNGNQNGLVVDGEAHDLVNANCYTIASDSMDVELYNDYIEEDGRPQGHWWIAINATGATIKMEDDSAPQSELILTKEAIFCPPEYQGELMRSLGLVVK